jgi:hypothetical protein
MIKRCNIAYKEIKTQKAFKSRIALIKSFLLKLINLIVYRRIISINLLGEFLNSEVIYNNYLELLEQLLREDDNLVKDTNNDLEL